MIVLWIYSGILSVLITVFRKDAGVFVLILPRFL